MPLEKKGPDEIVTRHTHTCTVQCNMQFDYRSGQLDFRSRLFLRPIATAHTFQAPGWGEPGNEAVGGWE